MERSEMKLIKGVSFSRKWTSHAPPPPGLGRKMPTKQKSNSVENCRTKCMKKGISCRKLLPFPWKWITQMCPNIFSQILIRNEDKKSSIKFIERKLILEEMLHNISYVYAYIIPHMSVESCRISNHATYTRSLTS